MTILGSSFSPQVQQKSQTHFSASSPTLCPTSEFRYTDSLDIRFKGASNMTPVTEVLAPAIGKIPSGFFVITAQDGDEKVGMVASFVQQIGFEPPSLSISMQPGRRIYDIIQKTGRFTVNILGGDGYAKLMGPFFKDNPFENVNYHSTDYGLALDDASAYVDCELKTTVDNAGLDHHLLIAEIKDGKVLNPDAEPKTHIRKNGLSY